MPTLASAGSAGDRALKFQRHFRATNGALHNQTPSRPPSLRALCGDSSLIFCAAIWARRRLSPPPGCCEPSLMVSALPGCHPSRNTRRPTPELSERPGRRSEHRFVALSALCESADFNPASACFAHTVASTAYAVTSPRSGCGAKQHGVHSVSTSERARPALQVG